MCLRFLRVACLSLWRGRALRIGVAGGCERQPRQRRREGASGQPAAFLGAPEPRAPAGREGAAPGRARARWGASARRLRRHSTHHAAEDNGVPMTSFFTRMVVAVRARLGSLRLPRAERGGEASQSFSAGRALVL